MKKLDISLPKELPLMAIRDLVMFPNMIVPFYVGRDESIKAMDQALRDTGNLFVVCSQKDISVDKPTTDDIYNYGVIAMILKTKNVPDGRIKILTQGLYKVKISEFKSTNPFVVTYEVLEDEKISDVKETKAFMNLIRGCLEELVQTGKIYPETINLLQEDVDDPSRFSDLIAANLNLKLEDSFSMLSEMNPTTRLKKLHAILTKEIEIHKLQQKIKSDTKEEVTKTQREYYLREQLQSIKKELGEFDDRDGFQKKIKDAKMTAEAEKEALKQAKRLDSLSPESSESAIIRHYLEWLIELPWSISTQDNLDAKNAKKILDEDHYGLEDVKERIMEYLSVRKLSPDAKGPILCLVGPPGVGKTSICKSVARSMGRKYVRQALGGVKDESEVRGHRRTYVGALPGKIVQGMKQAGSCNPVFVLDEIDKLGREFRGDPSSALLEVLDPEQNKEFKDHFLNVSYDLSKVMFIATANSLDTIPSPLLDRMEVINLSGYTEIEKIEICKRYLVPKQKKENGLDKVNVDFQEGSVQTILNRYSRENGVRSLERSIGKVFRKIALKINEGGIKITDKVPVTVSNVKDFLGIPKYSEDALRPKDSVGVVTGLAWTSVGGCTLELEGLVVPDTNFSIKVSGNLGQVMKESSDISFSVVKSMAEKYGIDLDKFKKKSIHVHALDGAVPKDGPSAGITMATVLMSILSNRPVRRDVAMTGELTLSGRVLPIGGLKEKLIAAARVGCKTVCIPKENEKDLEDVPKEILDILNIKCVETLDEVLDVAIVKDAPKKTSKGAIKKKGRK